ncbi:MAG: response regulator [Taibaiella sp.]|nr:response regulator [Taibaiella sp.]
MSPNISVLIVDDDLVKIYNIIDTIKDKVNVPLKIDQALSISEAIDYLKGNKYHLLISDILMPFHDGGNLIDNGGEILVGEIYKVRKKLNVPLYILGLTQHKNFISNFNQIWKVCYYDMSREEWKIYLRDLIFHINLIKSNLSQYTIETIFVEGINDSKLLNRTLEFYFPDKINKVKIDCVAYGGGVDWVERKILIWSKSLNKKENGIYIKSVGLFDNDIKGQKSIENINRVVSNNSAEDKTFSLLKTSYKYSILLKSLKAKGIRFETTMEDLIGIEVWKKGIINGWLEERKNIAFFSENEKVRLDKDYLKSLNLNEDEILLCLYKVKEEYKSAFTNLALQEKNNLLHISYLLKDCIDKLNIKCLA